MSSRRNEAAPAKAALADRAVGRPGDGAPAAQASGENCDDGAMQLAAQQLADLAELREIGMVLARALRDRAVAPAAEQGEDGIDIGLAFSRIARTVRQIVALEQEVAGLREQRLGRLRDLRLLERKRTVRRAVRDALRADDPEIERKVLRERLFDLFNDYRDDDELDYDRCTTGEIVARICRDLGVEPDWTLWADAPEAVAESPAVPPRDGFFSHAALSGGRPSPPLRPGRNGHDPP